MSADALKLTDGFATPTQAEWRALVDKALKGADFDKRLVTKSADGIRIEPLYSRRADASAVMPAGAGRPWRVSARVDHPSPEAAAEQALDDLKNAADSLTLVFPGGLSARGYGLPCDTVGNLDAALAGVALDWIALRVDPAPAGRINAALVAALVEKRGHNPAELAIDFGMDPIGNLAHRGMMAADWETLGRRLCDAATALKAKGFQGPYLTCDVRAYHEAGASEAQELGTILATGLAYLRALTENGWSAEDASRALSFTLAVDADQFLGIAKLRALRRLWARIEEASGIVPSPIRINAESSWRMLTRRDPWVNMLRGTMATFVAGVGGADSMTVHPHTAALGLPNGFARRIARNTQTVLLEESNLWRVADPCVGAGGVEALSDELAQSAWSSFQEIEAEGGIVASLQSGAIQGRIAVVREGRLTDVARRKVQITGTSEFPLLSEGVLEVVDIAADATRGLPKLRKGAADLPFAELIEALAAGKTRGEVTPGPAAEMKAQPLPSVRLAEPFEKLRDAADALKLKSGKHPQVFLASLGAIAQHTARSTWMKNLLAAGGLEAITSEGFASAGDAAAAFKSSGARLACICSSDDVYSDFAVSTAAALKDAGAHRILLAGRPGDLEEPLRKAGVDTFVFAGQDMVDLLGDLLNTASA